MQVKRSFLIANRPSNFVNGHPKGQFGCRLNLDIDVAAREQIWTDQIGGHAGIMQWCADAAVFFAIKTLKKIGHLRHSDADWIAQRAEFCASIASDRGGPLCRSWRRTLRRRVSSASRSVVASRSA